MSSQTDDIAALIAAAGSMDQSGVLDLSTLLPLPPTIASFTDETINTLLVHLFGDRDHPETPFEAPPETTKARPTLLDFDDLRIDPERAVAAQFYYDLYRRIIRVTWLANAQWYDEVSPLPVHDMLVQAVASGHAESSFLPIICAGIDLCYRRLAVAPDETTRGLPWTKHLQAEVSLNWPVRPVPYAYSVSALLAASEMSQLRLL
jgi:hypothetical protein